jgi:hypothetical protein
MLDILKNFDDVSTGKKTGAAGESKNEMKAILESFHRVNEAETPVEECGEGMPMQAMQAPQREGNPVTMNISLNASGKDNVDELMALLKGAGLDGAKVVGPADINQPSDQERDMAAMRAAMMATQDDTEEEVEEWDNSPEGVEGEPMSLDLPMDGDDLHRKKDRKAVRTTDPALESSIKDRLWAALNEKKTDEGKYANDAQRKAIHAAKDEKKKKK